MKINPSKFALAMALLAVGGCLMTNKESIVSSQVRRVANILKECGVAEGYEGRELECLKRYSKKSGTDIDLLLVDIYGGALVLKGESGCPGEVRLPYSTGPNGINECGGGDDIGG